MIIDVKVPVLAESVAEATLLNWQKNVGDHVKRGDNLIDIETDKVTLEVAALNDGVIAEILKQDGEIVHSDEIIAKIETDAKSAATKTEPAPAQQSLPEMDTRSEAIDADDLPKLSPAVRNLMEEHNLDAKEIPHDSDRITKEDVLKHLGQTPAPSKPAASKSSTPTEAAPPPDKVEAPQVVSAKEIATNADQVPVLTSSTGERPEEVVPMTRLRKRAAERLLGAQRENAILTTFNEVNLKAVMDVRQRYKDEFEKTHDVKLGLMSFFTRAAIEALKKFPIINASVDGDNIIYHGFFDIGIAVSSPRGLVVPILRDADLLSLADIESQIRTYGEKARDGKLTMDDLTGGTFTITNGGVFGSLLSTPIINPPQSAILGMHTIQQRPVAEDGEVVVRPMMYIALSYDHRIIDGRDAVQFLVSIKQQLEDPARLLLQL
ncbi:MAG: 2-oxoglutarate dehydrogenase complex dihydrolipoyllysine-residue succinyltransferase [Gammaproteobacteria bacterium]|nr:2-oxoglutarate dehydrogenase complex dihydrolipoyllysine-residue succinyltransferase [Gammaproteobacteria bacterium]